MSAQINQLFRLLSHLLSGLRTVALRPTHAVIRSWQQVLAEGATV
jgi:hypothetical protein